MRSKILFISGGASKKMFDMSDGGITGGDVRLAEIMRGAVNDGFEVHFLVTSGAELFCKKFNLSGVICHNFNFKNDPASRLGFVSLTFMILFSSLPKSLRNFNNGIVYTANELLWDVFSAIKLKLLNKNIKWVAVVHWLPPLKFWQRKKSRWINSLLFLVGERLSVFLIKYLADAILAVSNSTAKQLYKLGIDKNKIFSVKCGVHFDKINKISSKIREKKFDAVFMKRIQAVKGIFDLIDIWQFVVRKKPNAKLAIIGGGVDAHRFNHLIKERGLEDNIVSLGEIFDFERKIKMLSQSTMFILPSYEENWAIVMGEVMACKLPVLAYNLPELVEVWQNNFVRIPLGNKKFFAEEIINYLDNKILRDKQAELGYQYVQQFEWANIAKSEVNIIEKI